VFPPCDGAERAPRTSWVYASHGLTQPLKPGDKVDRSGDGWEFTIETEGPQDWAPLALQLLVEEVIAGAEFGIAHRVAGFFAERQGGLLPFFGTPEMHEAEPVGSLRWWLLFPQLRPWTELTCETGRFALLNAVGLCDDEFTLLEDVNGCGYHLQLLLCERGVGQRTDPLRPSVLSEAEGRRCWKRIRRLSAPEAWGEVVGRFSLPEGPAGSWPFADPANVTAFTQVTVVEGADVLHVCHDEDGAWQALDGGPARTDQAKLVSLGWLIQRDPTLRELAALPCGWSATRLDVTSPWRWAPLA